MRTTVTLDEDVAQELKQLARSKKVSFKAALNETIRSGLAARRGGSRPFRVDARPMRLRPGIDLTQALRLAEALEDEEISRKLELGK